jgi:hypothetical protein
MVKPTPPTDRRSPAAPLVSVIIATYNWSSALRLAIQSVQQQTMQDFEILVVGDACTDNSQAVVEQFGDVRIRWSNLAENCGCQQGPNNFGLGQAGGEWIAYLGHDDIWAPHHLESTISAALKAASQVAVGGMIMYGPPGSGVTMTAGIFAQGRCSDRDFVPPSALVHTRALIDQIGTWADPRSLRLPVDCDFFRRARRASEVASNNQITVFKFNAASRRNAYQIKSTLEQEHCLAGLERGDAFVAEELTKVVASVVAGKWSSIGFPPDRDPGELFHRYRVNKGVEPRYQPDQLSTLTELKRFRLDREETGNEWHSLEHSPRFGSFRWTAASERSTIELPIRLDQSFSVRIHLLAASERKSLERVVILAQGAPIETTLWRTKGGTWIVSGVIESGGCASPVPYVQVALSGVKAVRPIDLGVNSDRRHLGLAVSWIELAPLPERKHRLWMMGESQRQAVADE